MTKETEVALAAISALCGKRKAKALKKLVLAAIEAERALASLYIGPNIGGITFQPLGAGTTDIGTTLIAGSGDARIVGGHYTDTYTAKGPG